MKKRGFKAVADTARAIKNDIARATGLEVKFSTNRFQELIYTILTPTGMEVAEMNFKWYEDRGLVWGQLSGGNKEFWNLGVLLARKYQ